MGGDDEAQFPTRFGSLCIIVSVPYVDGTSWGEVRPESVHIRDCWPVQANGSGKVFTGDASALLAVARVPKVSVAIYMNQASPAAPRESEADSE